jgi:hypothetical protein
MMNKNRLEVGARVRVMPQHWLRAGEVGEIIGGEERGRSRWLIQFDIKYPGGGIDGDKLWIDASALSEMTDNDVRAYRPHHIESADERSTPTNRR